ncbi:MAG: peptidylprolyl isomerase [Oscillospiraceae bacterium]|jgi:peptidyl-prolyl cis-trans isomerase B (cyclophilin B)|nr:peptidylprolyl isomerase [Oscillospiraceae bacterium]
MKLKRLTTLLVIVYAFLAVMYGCVTTGDTQPVATVKFSDGGQVRIRLYPEYAPNTVNNFIALANSGFYDGSPVHRIVEYFVIQMGRPGTDQEELDYTLKGEFPSNGYAKNTLSHELGVVSMARKVGNPGSEADYYDSATSQFFICVDNEQKTLDGDYAAFGRVTEADDITQILKISRMDVDADSVPRDEIYITELRVNTYGKVFPEPEKIRE